MDISPFVKAISEPKTVRLVASARDRPPVLSLLVSKEEIDQLVEIEGATSGRLRAQEKGSDRLDSRELVYGVPGSSFINAAFSYPRPRALNRFNGPGRGAWYAALDLNTCIAEVSFHMTRELENVGHYRATVRYAEIFAGFIGQFVDLRSADPSPACLAPDVEQAYREGNTLAEEVRNRGLGGIVYSSVRFAGGTCLVALVPHVVQAVTQGDWIEMTWAGEPTPKVSRPLS